MAPMLTFLSSRYVTAALLGICWAFAIFWSGDSSDRDDFNGRFEDKIDQQLEDQGR